MYSQPTPRGRALDEGYRPIEIPRFVQYTSIVDQPQQHSDSPAANLPLNVLMLIISFIDDNADIARLTRTSRLFCWITLPRLYENVTLKAYPDLRCISGRPEGFGGGSPFAMALNGLATRNNVISVKRFALKGQWNESEEEYTKGRIPDATTMLNTLLRIAVDRMTRLQSFTWDLSTKPLTPLYQGLAARESLTSLSIRFPSSRIPRPATVVPAMPNLRAFRAFDIDPLCYPDDLTLLLSGSKKLLDLRLHFSPRMRAQGEPTLTIDMFFGRCFREKWLPKLRHFALQNFFGRQMDMMQHVYDHETCRSSCYLDVFGGAKATSASIYIDDTWRNLPATLVSTQKTLRINEPATQHVKMLQNATVLMERFYCVNDHPRSPSRVGTPASVVTPIPSPVDSAYSNPELVALGKDYLHVLTRKHGSALQHLLLCDQWALSQQEIGDIVRLCPNLTQLGVALDGQAFEVFRIIVQFLQHLTAIRIFDNDVFRRHREEMSHEERLLFVGRDFYRLNMHNIEYVSAGDEIFRLLGNKEIVLADGTTEMVRELEVLTAQDVQHVEIFALDKFDIMIEPPVLECAG